MNKHIQHPVVTAAELQPDASGIKWIVVKDESGLQWLEHVWLPQASFNSWTGFGKKDKRGNHLIMAGMKDALGGVDTSFAVTSHTTELAMLAHALVTARGNFLNRKLPDAGQINQDWRELENTGQDDAAIIVVLTKRYGCTATQLREIIEAEVKSDETELIETAYAGTAPIWEPEEPIEATVMPMGVWVAAQDMGDMVLDVYARKYANSARKFIYERMVNKNVCMEKGMLCIFDCGDLEKDWEPVWMMLVPPMPEVEA